MQKYIYNSDHFTEEIASGIYRISDIGLTNSYLILGTDRALLIDVGTGFSDIRGAAEKLTSLPIDVVCTHGHVDHAGGMWQFDRIYLHEKDVKGLKFMTSRIVRYVFLLSSEIITKVHIPWKLVKKVKNTEVVPIKDGHVFELGGRTVRTQNLEGHTLGSIILFDDSTKTLFVGDDVSTSAWVYLPNAAPLETWLASAKTIAKYAEDYTVYWGHEEGLIGNKMINHVASLGDEIMAKYTKNSPFMRVVFYPCNDRVNGSVVFRTSYVHKK